MGRATIIERAQKNSVKTYDVRRVRRCREAQIHTFFVSFLMSCRSTNGRFIHIIIR